MILLTPKIKLLKEFHDKYGKAIKDEIVEQVKTNIEDRKDEIKEQLDELKENIRDKAKEAVQLITTPINSVMERIYKGESCKDDISVKRYATFSAHCYGTYNDYILPVGSRVVKKYDLDDGTEATVYEHVTEIICAFTGSDDAKDWINNGLQLIGVAPQYESALKIANEVMSMYSSSTITFVGHSKGGGQAAYCALVLGVNAVTFNPAGVSIPTRILNDFKENKGECIHAYVFNTDILNRVQEMFGFMGLQADGHIHYINDFKPQGGSIIDKIHGIGGILDYFEVSDIPLYGFPKNY